MDREAFDDWLRRPRAHSLVPDEDLYVLVTLAQSAPHGMLDWIAKDQGRKLWLYDTFTGIPFFGEGDSHEIGFFKGKTQEQIQAEFPDAIVQGGIFPRGQEIPERIAFVHLDVDQYQSYRECLDFLLPRMLPGGLILCDDYCLKGAKRAIDETPGAQILPNERALFRC